MMKNISFVALLLCLGLTSKSTAINYTVAANDNDPASAQIQDSNQKSKHKQIPIDSMYRVMAAEMAIDRVQHESAVANYILAAQETQDPKIAQRATQVALNVSSLETALDPALIWAKTAPKSLEANLTVAAIFIRLKSHHKAAHYLTKIEKLEPSQAYYHFLLVYRQLQGTNGQDVIDTLKYLVESAPLPGAMLALGEIKLAQGEFETSLEFAGKVLNIEPNNSGAIRLKSESLLKLKGSEAAQSFLGEKVIALPEDNDLSSYYVQFLITENKTELARAHLEKLLDANLNPDQSLSLARVAMQAHWYTLAEKSLKKTLGSKDHQNTTHYLLARLAELQEKSDDAIKWYKEVISGPFHVMSQIKASQLLTDKKAYNKAIDILKNTQPQNEFDNKRVVLSLTDIYNRKHDYIAAVEILDKILKYQPDDIEFLYARAINAEKMNQFTLAQKDLLQILSQDPYHIEALNALGYMLTVHTKKYDEALEYLNRALELAPNNASVLDSIGWLNYKMGNLQEALGHLRKAAEIMPDTEIAAHLGEVLWKLNNRDEAKAIWNSALESNPEDSIVIEAMKRLKSE
jgi:tetratricopeptide (TPR) repeat protein